MEFRKRIFVLTLLFELAGVSTPCPVKCVTPCKLNNQGEITGLECSDVQIQTLPNTVEKLHVQDLLYEPNLPFGRFDEYILSGKSHLQHLGINNFRITSLSGECFKVCTGLLTLDLSHNDINVLKEANFAGLRNLTYLNLNQNNLSTIVNFTFKNLQSLKILSIVENKLTSILKDDFAGLDNIARIELHNNQIWHIDTKAFQALKTLEYLNMQHNQLTQISAGMFSNLPNLREINLQSNRITSLNPSSMLGTRLTKLDLWQNEISDIPRELLRNIGHLGLTVNLARNNIMGVGADALSGVVLGTLYLVANNITQIHPDALNNSFLQMLDLQQNLLQHIPEALHNHINQSQTLLLANNPWSCDCDIQWVKSLLKNSEQEPTCAEPRSYFGSKLSDVIRDLELVCNPHMATLPVPTTYLQIPPKHNYLTPKLDKEQPVPTTYLQIPPKHNYLTPKLDKEQASTTEVTETVSMTTITTTTRKSADTTNTTGIIAGVVAGLIVIGVVAVVIKCLMSKPKIIPEPEMLIQSAEISFKPCLKYTPQENGWTAVV